MTDPMTGRQVPRQACVSHMHTHNHYLLTNNADTFAMHAAHTKKIMTVKLFIMTTQTATAAQLFGISASNYSEQRVYQASSTH